MAPDVKETNLLASRYGCEGCGTAKIVDPTVQEDLWMTPSMSGRKKVEGVMLTMSPILSWFYPIWPIFLLRHRDRDGVAVLIKATTFAGRASHRGDASRIPGPSVLV